MTETTKFCSWSQADERSDTWWTDCGNGFTFIEGGPKGNDMNYCCYCGKILDEVLWEEPEDEDEDEDDSGS